MSPQAGNAGLSAPESGKAKASKTLPSIGDKGVVLDNIPEDASENLSDDPLAMAKQMAEAIADAMRKRAQEDEKQEEVAEEEGHVWFLVCSSWDHPAMFFTKNPRRHAIFPKDWYNSHKAPGAYWPSSVVPCSQCAREARVRMHQQGHLVINSRFLRSMSKEQFANMTKGISRSEFVKIISNNRGEA